MPRGRLGRNGPELAEFGYDVDTAPLAKMRYSPQLVAMRLALTDTIVTSPSGEAVPYNTYNKATITFATPFPEPPIAMAAGINPDGTSDQSAFVINSVTVGELGVSPHYILYSYVDRLDLYAMNWPGQYVAPTTWRYFVFDNTLSG